MLINVNPLISPEILSLIRSMGHGDKFVLSDANFPSYSQGNKLYRMDGLNLPQAAEALLTHFPLDSFVVSQGGSPALRMEVDNKPDELTETHKEFIEVVNSVSGEHWKVGSISRQDFLLTSEANFLSSIPSFSLG